MSEFENQIEQVFGAIQDLRDAGGDGPRTRKLLDALFRNVHNLKAAASANGLNELSRLAHEFENLLHSLRTGKVKLDDDVLRVFNDTADALRASLTAENPNKPEAPLSRRVEQPELADGSRLDMVPAEMRTLLTAEARHRLSESLREAANLYLVESNFEVSDFDRQFQQLKETLEKSGEVISTAPKLKSDRTDRINFRVLFTSQVDVEQLRQELSGIPNVAVTQRVQLDGILQQAVRAGRSIAALTDKEIEFVIRGGDVSLERSLCEGLAGPLLHLVRNAVDHGIETKDERIKLGKNASGKIVIEAAALQEQARITVTDDGRGIDPAAVANAAIQLGMLEQDAVVDLDQSVGLLFQPGLSTASKVSEISGRGVGLDVVKTTVEALGGSISVSSELGKGSVFEIKIPTNTFY